MGIDLLCQDNKPFVRVNKDNNYSKVDKAQQGIINGNYVLAGFTAFTAYRITFDDEDRMFMQTDDFTFSESYDVTLGNGSINNREIRAGVAGDCYRNPTIGNPSSLAYLGTFSLDLTETGLAFHESVEWISIGARHGMVKYL